MRLKSILLFSLFLLFITGIPAVMAQEIDLSSRIERDNTVNPANLFSGEDQIDLPGGSIKLISGAVPASNAHGLMIVQFGVELGESQQAALDAAGIELLDYIDANAYWIRINGNSSTVPFARAYAIPEAADKIESGFARLLSSRSSSETVEIIVVPASEEDIDSVVTALSTITESTKVERLFGGRIKANVPASAVHSIAADDRVIAVEYAGWKKKLDNNASAGHISTDDARDNFGLSGQGVNVGIWDGGPVFKHKEFENRLTVMQNALKISDHATHVAGSIGAAGKNNSARGMAPDAMLYSYDFNGNSVTEMANAVKQPGIVLSNNSWGYVIGWEWNGWYLKGWGPIMSWFGNSELFGKYTNESRALDALITGKKLSVIFSAGNDRNDEVFDFYYYDEVKQKLVERFVNDQDGPYMTVGPTGSAKNVIAVGASKGPKTMSDFSSWGPTRDGRLKPEITAPGVDIFSTTPDNKYDKMSGTSMSAPITTGSLALLMEQWNRVHGEYPDPAIIRNLIALTATEIGAAGPDYRYGFGILNVWACAWMIDASADANVILEDKVKRGKTVAYTLNIANNLNYLRVCVAWLDPAGPTLVNDIDIRVIAPNGKQYLPLTLNPGAPGANAKAKVNTRDNIELVQISRPKAGDGWTIEVSASRLGKGNKQKYVLSVIGY